MDKALNIILIVLAACALIGVGALWQWVNQSRKRLVLLEQENRSQKQRIEFQQKTLDEERQEHARKLEELSKPGPARHTENTVAGLEDLTASLIRVLFEEQTQASVRQAWLEQAMRIVNMLREGPRAYPVDMPSGTQRVKYSETYIREVR